MTDPDGPEAGGTVGGGDGRFVWPPRPLHDPGASGAQQTEPQAGAARTERRPGGGPERADGHLIRHHAEAGNFADDNGGSWWRCVEQAWLGLVAPPLAERLAAADFEPDALKTYCPGCGRSVGPYEVIEPAPARHGSRVVRASCSGCRGRRPPWDLVVRLGLYEGVLGGVVRDVKFTRWRALGDTTGRLLGASVGEALEAWPSVTGRPAVGDTWPIVVPMPMSHRRRMVRGVDHALAVARGVRAELGGDVRLLLRRRHRPQQTGLSVAARRANVAGTIRCRRPPPAGRVVVLVDDVMTTGATMRSACQAIRAAERRAGRPPTERCRLVAALVCVAEHGT